ncbi:MAG: hypothetical protein NTU85_02695 [Candidatus Kaiserbacteria bacterium]|nr:hypothetical protein [Candidatus Kaiserbacteria bacterium]
MRGILTILVFISVIFFPWPLTAVFVLVASFFIPFLPFAIGIFADTLYYTSKTEWLPLLTLYGMLTTCLALFVCSRLRASSMSR